jgi:hypothetical protein
VFYIFTTMFAPTRNTAVFLLRSCRAVAHVCTTSGRRLALHMDMQSTSLSIMVNSE